MAGSGKSDEESVSEPGARIDVERPSRGDVVDHSTGVVEGPAVKEDASDAKAVTVDPESEDPKSLVSNVLVEKGSSYIPK